MDYVLVSLQHSCVAILVPHVMVLGGGAFSRSLGHKGGSHMNGIRALLKGTPESSRALFPTMWGDKKLAVYNWKRALSRPHTLDLPAPWAVRSNCLLFKPPLVHGILV